MAAALRHLVASRRHALAEHGLGLVLVAAIGLLTVLPVLVVVAGSFAGHAWQLAIGSEVNLQSVGYSLLVASRAPFAAAIGFFLAWLLIRVDLPRSGTLEFMFWLSFFMPLIPLTLGWMLLLDGHDGLINLAAEKLPFVTGPLFNINSLAGIIWVNTTAQSVPVIVILLGPALRQLDASLEHAGRICGSRPLQVFCRLTLPLLLPAILIAVIMGFIRGIEGYEVEQLLGAPAKIYVYTTRVYSLFNWEPPRFAEAMALSTAMLIFLFVLACFYHYVTRRGAHATMGGVGMSFQRIDIGRWRYVVSGALFVLVGITIVLPLVFLLLGSFMKVFGYFDIPQPFTLHNWQVVLRDAAFIPSLENSLLLATGAAAIGIIVYAVVAHVIVRSNLRYRGVATLLAWLPWCIPGILLGIGILTLVLFNPILKPLFGTLSLLIIAVVIAQFPLGVTLMMNSIGQIGRQLEFASQVCGAGRRTTFVRIVLPLLRPTLASVFILVFIAALRDVSTVLLLSQPGTLPLSVLTLEYANSGAVEAAAVVGIISTVMVVIAAALARRLGLNIVQVPRH